MMNSLLAFLPDEDRQRLAAHVNLRPLRARDVLQKNDEPVLEIFFPGRSVCSITHTMQDGATLEVAMVGPEGLIGLGALADDPMVLGDAFVQVQGDPAHVLPVDIFRQEMERRGALHGSVSRYAQAFLAMVMRSVACNGLHSAEQRCCRWLLSARDRIGSDEFALTHDSVAAALGLRRPTVTLVIAELNRAGLVSHARGRIRITDRPGLERACCECYHHVKAVFHRLLPFHHLGTGFAEFHVRGGDMPAPSMERMSDVRRKSE
jgi:CRP-like cAMP-binding protein